MGLKKETAKTIMKWFGAGVKTGGKAIKGVGHGLLEVSRAMPRTTVVGASILSAKAFGEKGEGVLPFWQRQLLGTSSEEGALQGVKNLAFGEDSKDVGVVETVTDFVAGQGTYDAATAKAHELADRTKEGLAAGGQRVRDAYHDVRDRLSDDGDDDTLDTYEGLEETEMYRQTSDGTLAGYGNSGEKSLLQRLFDNKDSSMGTAGLAASLWLLFGRFGWLGKAAGVLTGYMSLNHMKSGYEQQVMAARSQGRSAGENYDRLMDDSRHDQERRSTVVNRYF